MAGPAWKGPTEGLKVWFRKLILRALAVEASEATADASCGSCLRRVSGLEEARTLRPATMAWNRDSHSMDWVRLKVVVGSS